MTINPPTFCVLQGWDGDLLCWMPVAVSVVLCCIFIHKDKDLNVNMHVLCGAYLYTNTTCFFMEAVPYSCKIGNRTTVETACRGISQKDWSYPKTTKRVFSPPQQHVGGAGTIEGTKLYHLSLYFFQALVFSSVTAQRCESAPGILTIFQCT